MSDIVTELRNRHANVTGIDPRITTPIVGATIFLEAADEIERLRAERDECTRLACRNAVLVLEVDRIRAERDEARREVCELQAELPEERLVFWNAARLPKATAAKRGWDCFESKNHDK
jgi:hypothetical protein